jgi:Tol biopolymer transport system component
LSARRFVAFSSGATNLVRGGTGPGGGIYVRDRQTGTTTLVSISSAGAQANEWSLAPAISADGRFVAFQSSATNLVPGDTNGQDDVFVRDRQAGITKRVSTTGPAGAQGNWQSGSPAISADGYFVAYMSKATNLVPGDTNGQDDVFVRDRHTGITTRISVSSNGT